MSYYQVPDEDRSPLPVWAVKEDAKRWTEKNSELYTPEELAYGEFIKGRAQSVYFRTANKVYLNIREKGLVVSVNKPDRRDKISGEVAQFDFYCEDRNIVRKVTAKHNITYTIPKDELKNLIPS